MWETPARPLRLAPDEVHVWRAWQHRPPLPHDALERTLSEEERRRAHRFVMPHLTEKFIVAHAFLRDVLGAYLGVDPASLHFDAHEHGKPFLIGQALHFNLTHSENLAALAVATRDLGVDVEYMRARVLDEGVAERFFSPLEVSMLHALPREQRELGFFNCWTRKEAYLKALGSGLRIPLDRFDVTLAPGEPARLIADRGSAELHRWQLAAFDPGEGYRGAVVAEGGDWRLRTFHWDGPL